MNDDAAQIRALNKTLVLNGAIIVLAGFVAGGFLSMVAVGNMSGEVAHWNLAHMECLLNGMFLFLVVGIRRALDLSLRQHRVLTWCFILMAYGNAVFGWLRGIYSVSGLTGEAPLANQLAAAAGGIGVPLGTIGLVLVVMGALRTASRT
jgi:hypothetical protein